MRMSEAQAKAMLGKHYKPAKPKAKTKKSKEPSEGERILELQLQFAGIAFKREFKFHATRKWRADFLITDTRILVEVEGGVWSGGRHTRGKGYEDDAEKYSSAAMEGWIVLRFTTGQVKAGKAIEMILRALGK